MSLLLGQLYIFNVLIIVPTWLPGLNYKVIHLECLVNVHIFLLSYWFTETTVDVTDPATAPVEIRNYLAYLRESELSVMPASEEPAAPQVAPEDQKK
jgi:hypothetical protein